MKAFVLLAAGAGLWWFGVTRLQKEPLALFPMGLGAFLVGFALLSVLDWVKR